MAARAAGDGAGPPDVQQGNNAAVQADEDVDTNPQVAWVAHSYAEWAEAHASAAELRSLKEVVAGLIRGWENAPAQPGQAGAAPEGGTSSRYLQLAHMFSLRNQLVREGSTLMRRCEQGRWFTETPFADTEQPRLEREALERWRAVEGRVPAVNGDEVEAAFIALRSEVIDHKLRVDVLAQRVMQGSAEVSRLLESATAMREQMSVLEIRLPQQREDFRRLHKEFARQLEQANRYRSGLGVMLDNGSDLTKAGANCRFLMKSCREMKAVVDQLCGFDAIVESDDLDFVPERDIPGAAGVALRGMRDAVNQAAVSAGGQQLEAHPPPAPARAPAGAAVDDASEAKTESDGNADTQAPDIPSPVSRSPDAKRCRAFLTQYSAFRDWCQERVNESSALVWARRSQDYQACVARLACLVGQERAERALPPCEVNANTYDRMYESLIRVSTRIASFSENIRDTQAQFLQALSSELWSKSSLQLVMSLNPRDPASLIQVADSVRELRDQVSSLSNFVATAGLRRVLG